MDYTPDGLSTALDLKMEGDNDSAIDEYIRDGGDVKYVFVNTGETHLHGCAYRGFIKCVKKLIENGADVNAVDNCNMTALHYAIEYLHDTPDNRISNQHIEVIEFLLKQGSDLTIRQNMLSNDTPLELAEHHGYSEVVAIIENYVANQNIDPKSAGNRK